jgi:hypothetical protein
MKHLFDEKDHYNEQTTKVVYEFEKAITAIFDKYIDQGYSTIDLEMIAFDAINMVAVTGRIARDATDLKFKTFHGHNLKGESSDAIL